jgi:hypothetical protein
MLLQLVIFISVTHHFNLEYLFLMLCLLCLQRQNAPKVKQHNVHSKNRARKTHNQTVCLHLNVFLCVLNFWSVFRFIYQNMFIVHFV